MSVCVSEEIIHSVIQSEKLNKSFAKCVASSYLYETLMVSSVDRFFDLSPDISDKGKHFIATWLIKFYNCVAETYESEFDNPNESKSWIVNPWGLYGITCFASMIRSCVDWRDITIKSLQYVNWTNTSVVSGISENIEINMLMIFKEACSRGVQRVD